MINEAQTLAHKGGSSSTLKTRQARVPELRESCEFSALGNLQQLSQDKVKDNEMQSCLASLVVMALDSSHLGFGTDPSYHSDGEAAWGLGHDTKVKFATAEKFCYLFQALKKKNPHLYKEISTERPISYSHV